jgi:hypothetical protein
MSARHLPEARLLIREWIAVVLVFAIIFSLGVISWKSDRIAYEKVKGGLHVSEPLLSLKVEGAVISPGIYHFPPGITLKEVLKTVKLQKNADRRKLKIKRVYYSSDTLIVPAKSAVQKRGQKKKKVERKAPS